MKKQLLIISWVLVLSITHVCAQDSALLHTKTVTISGFVKEKGSLESLPGAAIYIRTLQKGTISNNYGFYSITIPAGTYDVEFSFVGFTKSIQKLSLTESKNLDVELEASNALQEVVIKGNKESQKISELTQMSSVTVPIDQIKNIPALFGEKDVFKVLQLFPGVKKGSEGSSGFYVRGGTPDQNLIILDDAVVYNANHLFGFFSIFNGDALKSVELIKGGFPARFGERLSSVTIVNMKDGNKEKLHGEAGIGILSSRLTLEGPIKKGKSSFLVSGRRTYFDILSTPFQSSDEKIGLYFYDFNAKYSAYINEKNKFYLSGYFGRDKLYSTPKGDGTNLDFNWGNATLTARWNHVFGNKLFSNTSLIYSSYDLNINIKDIKGNVTNGILYSSGITDFGGKFDVDYSIGTDHFIRAGIRSITHMFKPNVTSYLGTNANPSIEQKYNAWENNLYVEDDWKISAPLNVNAGLRASSFATGGLIYWNVEPRLSTKLALGNNLALKASYARMNQYIHLLSNTGIGLPTDLWVPSTQTVKPQRSDQIALGLAKDLPESNFTVSLEGYYKKMSNIISYLPGASFVDVSTSEKKNNNTQINPWENNIAAGQGKSYGAELLIQRKAGKLSGWLGYTLSWIRYQFDQINLGQEFAPLQDRRHDISLVGIYQPSPKIKLSLTWVYSSGAPGQVGRAQYSIQQIDGRLVPYNINNTYGDTQNNAVDYGTRGSYTAEAYHRLDFGAQFIKKKTRGERIWELGVYNIYNRLNPFFYFPKDVSPNNQTTTTDRRLYKTVIFPVIPSITYTRKF